VPVTVKLSKRFYDTFGEDVANELVGLLNVVDAASRADVTRLADEYHARLRGELEHLATKADFERFATKADLERFATKADLERFATKADLERYATKEDLAVLRGELRADMAALKADLMKWMLVFWVGTSLTTVSLVLTVVGVLR
jgi:hypothetical protein